MEESTFSVGYEVTAYRGVKLAPTDGPAKRVGNTVAPWSCYHNMAHLTDTHNIVGRVLKRVPGW